MGISKKALEELAKSRETSVEALKPIKESLVQIAVSKDFDKLKAVNEELVLNTTLTSLTYSTLKTLIEKGVLRNASSAKLRTFAGELTACYSPNVTSSLPDRVIRDIIAENWKEHKEVFPLEGSVVTYGGSRITRLHTAFSMVVENSRELRRYLKVCHKSLPTNVGVYYSALPVSVGMFERCLLKHPFTPSHSRSNSTMISLQTLWSLSDKEKVYLENLAANELAWTLKNWSNLTSLRSFYSPHHSLSSALEVAKQRAMQSITKSVFPGKQFHQDFASHLPDREAEFSAIAGGARELDGKKVLYVKFLQNLVTDWSNNLASLFLELWSNLTKQSRGDADKAAIDSCEFVNSLLQPSPFLLVTLEYVPLRAYVDSTGVHRNALLEDVRASKFKSFGEVFDSVGVNLDQVITKSLLRRGITQSETNSLTTLRQEIRLPVEGLPMSISGDTGFRDSIYRGIVSSPERVIGTLTQISTIFDTLQRRNVWTTLLKQKS